MVAEDKDMAFTRLVNAHSMAILRYTSRRLSDAASCDDVVAETFLIVWRRWDDLPSPDKELPWLYSIAFHVLSNHRRSRDRRNRLHARLAMERDPIEGLDASGLDAGPVLLALDKLRTHERELLEFVYWEKLTYHDIALILGISENAVGIRINRAKTNLRTHLQPRSEEVPNVTIIRGELES
jgi:RNA polymerase sigma-70 factor (ECF subfamily)